MCLNRSFTFYMYRSPRDDARFGVSFGGPHLGDFTVGRFEVRQLCAHFSKSWWEVCMTVHIFISLDPHETY